MNTSSLAFLLGLTLLAAPVSAQGVLLPQWAAPVSSPDEVLVLDVPAQLQQAPPAAQPRFLVLRLAADWAPDYKQAAFQLKNQIVTLKTSGPNVKVALEGRPAQVDGLLQYELAAYIDGYLYTDEPYIPEADPTGRLWLRSDAVGEKVLTQLLDAASLGVEVVILDKAGLDHAHADFLRTIAATDTGALDVQPSINNFAAGAATFFFDPDSGDYQLALYADPTRDQYLSFNLAEGVETTLLWPQGADYAAKQYGERTELNLTGKNPYYFFKLTPAERLARTERLEIRGRKVVDPYELVVKNQVFKDAQAQAYQSLRVDEEQNYRYQVPGGVGINVTYRDELFLRKDQPAERVRKEILIGGAKWPYKDQPELPLIQPEKVQREPLVVDLDKTYEYTYKGEDTVGGRKAWRVGFKPGGEGNFFTGTVWIDQENGAHLRITALQSGLEAPVTANEVTAFFGWVDDGGKRFWTQTSEKNLQVLSIAGAQVALQIESTRSNHRFNRDNTDQELLAIYEGDATILRDTPEGFRYLVKKAGQRQVSDKDFTRTRAIPGGVLKTDDSVLPLAGYNITDLDFLDRGWTLTAELFLSAFYGQDEIISNGEAIDSLTVQELRESLNLTLGIPINGFWKLDFNLETGYWGYKEGEEMNQDDLDGNPPEFLYVLPSDHIEHSLAVDLTYNWKRFSSSLSYTTTSRSSWETFGLENNPEPLFDGYRKLEFDSTVSKKFSGFNTLSADFGYLKGWDLDRFSRFGFGLFENSVAGYSSSGIEADEAFLFSLEYEFGVADIFNLEVQLDGARAIINELDNTTVTGSPLDEVNFYGVGLASNFIGPYKTVIRVNVGYGLDSDLKEEAGDWTGQIVFLKLF